MKLCPRCEAKPKPKGVRVCNSCAREINSMRDDPMLHMRALRALTDHGRDKELACYGFLTIMHPLMSHSRKRAISGATTF